MRELGITRDDTMGDGKKQNNDDTTGCNPAQVEEAIALRAVVREQAELIQRLAAFAEAYMRRKHAEAIAEYTSCHRCGRAEPLQDQHGMKILATLKTTHMQHCPPRKAPPLLPLMRTIVSIPLEQGMERSATESIFCVMRMLRHAKACRGAS